MAETEGDPSRDGWEEHDGYRIWLGSQQLDRAVWLTHRDGRVGGSDVSAALGRSPWMRADALAARLRAQRAGRPVEPIKSNAAMMRGTRLEPVARAMYAAACLDGSALREVGIIHPTRAPAVAGRGIPPGAVIPADIISVSPDGLVGNDGIVEFKAPTRPDEKFIKACEAAIFSEVRVAMPEIPPPSAEELAASKYPATPPSARGYGRVVRAAVHADAISTNYVDQMQYCLGITGRAWADYAVLVEVADQGYDLYVVRISASEPYWDDMKRGLYHFSRKL